MIKPGIYQHKQHYRFNVTQEDFTLERIMNYLTCSPVIKRLS